MITKHTHTEVSMIARRAHRAGALVSAAGAAIVLLLGATAAGADAPAPAVTATTQPAAASGQSFVTEGLNDGNAIKLLTGKSLVLTTRSACKRVSVGQPDVADVTVIAPSSILVTAKKPGETQLILWDEQDHAQVVNVTVNVDLEAVKQQLKAAFPKVPMIVTALNDTISLRGNVPSQQVAEQAVEMVSSYGKVHNFLEISGGQQVLLQVRFAEVDKTAERDLGVNFGGTDGVSTFANNAGGAFPLGTGGALPGLGGLSGGGTGTLFGHGQVGSVAFDYFIQALRQNNLMRMLAEPNLVATSGQDASFLAGGEFPVPVPQSGSGGAGVTTVEFHEFGVRLHFIPQVLGDGRIRLKVEPEVSSLDFSQGTTINGGRVPAFTKQTVSTTVELADGQTFALAGLLNNKVTAIVDAVPVLGDIPILGDLFKSTHFLRNQSELVVIVTPRLVKPMDPDQVPLLPGEHWRYPTPTQLYLGRDMGGPMVEPASASTDKTDKAHAGPPPEFKGTFGFFPAGAGKAGPVR